MRFHQPMAKNLTDKEAYTLTKLIISVSKKTHLN